MANETFISYSRANSHFAIRLEQALKNFGIDSWIDWEDIPPISPWREEILIAIQACSNFIFILSPQSISSVECLNELNQALRLDKRLIPIVAEPVTAKDVPLALREFNWIFFGDFDEGVSQLCCVLDSDSSVSFEQLNNKICLKSGDNTREFILQRNSYLIGRNPPGTVQEFGLIYVAGDPFCSRCAATLLKVEKRWYIADGYYHLQDNKLNSYKESRNGLKLKEGVHSTRFLKRRSLFPLTHNCEIVFSPLTSLKYVELYPETPRQPLQDDRPTLGQQDGQ